MKEINERSNKRVALVGVGRYDAALAEMNVTRCYLRMLAPRGTCMLQVTKNLEKQMIITITQFLTSSSVSSIQTQHNYNYSVSIACG